ncbi:MAG: aldose 1-epimerase [Planctomycetaceae bacterium]|nr:aldose 1-epimerase [Planctomycetales bacterium]MCB9874416.1 aldose 1-epimerase [Planctomycetaceae bacterium]
MTIENIRLNDPSTGAQASILASFGFNCYEFVANLDGRKVDVLWSAPGFASGNERASGSGIPLLFPFPGRLRGTTFHWDGREYSLDAGDGRGNAIHGFVLNRPWRVIERSASRVVGQFQASVDDPKILEQWPADFRVTATYELIGNRLSSSFVFENPDDKALPCGFGTHPYFRLPLGGSSGDSCRVTIPAGRHWELVDMLPTGNCSELAEANAYQQGLRFGDMKFDDVFGGLVFSGEDCVSEIVDSESSTRLSMRFDRSFRELVVYTPPHREAVCVEPYTCVPGTVGLDVTGVDFGLRVLQPGESFVSRVEMEVR